MALSEDYTNKETGLTEKEQYFLDILFDEHRGDIRKAMNAAGYDKKVPTSLLRNKLEQHILKASRVWLATNTGKAVVSLVDVLDDPTQMGAGNAIKAAKEILDRTGVVAPQEQVTIERNIFILPAKDEE